MHLESGHHLYGGARQVRYLIEGLAAHGIENLLVCPQGSAVAAAPCAARVVPLPMGGDLDVRLCSRLKGVMATHRPSLLHVHSRRGADTAGGWSARRAGVPAVLTRRVDAREPACWARLKYRPYRAVVAISSAVEAQLVHRVGLDASRVFTVASAVDAQRYRPAPVHDRLAATLGLPARSLLIGVVAQLIPRKGHGLLFECLPALFARHPTAYVLCFGRGPLKDTLMRRLAQLRLEPRVRLLGFREDLPDLLPGLDLLVHPARREGLGVAVLEAMSAGVAVVSSTAGGLTDLIESGVHGLTFAPGDRDGLLGAMARLLSDAELRARLGASGRARVRAEFSVERMSARYLDIYHRALGTSP